MAMRKCLSYLSLGLALISHSAFAQGMMGSPSSGPSDNQQIIWNEPGQTSAPPPATKHPPAAARPAPAPAAMAPNPDQRNIDDRKLNSLASQYMHINPKAPDASAKLAKLSKQVDAFHKALFTRSYNAMDILKDTESLQGRIAAARTKAAEANPTPPPAPTPASAPAPQPSAAPHDVPPPAPTPAQ